MTKENLDCRQGRRFNQVQSTEKLAFFGTLSMIVLIVILLVVS